MTATHRKFLLSLSILLSIACVAYATDYTWDNGGTGSNWNVADNWNPSGIPGAGDNVTISGGTYGVDIPAGYNAACNNLTIGSDATFSVDVTLSASTSTLTVNGDLTLDCKLAPSMTRTTYLYVDNGTVTVVGNATVNGSTGGIRTHNSVIDVDQGTLEIQGNLTLNPVVTGGVAKIDMGTSATLKLGGTIVESGANSGEEIFLSGGECTIEYDGAGAQTVYTSLDGTAIDYDNLILSNAGVKTLDGNVSIKYDLTISGTASLDVNAAGPHNIDIEGNWIVTSTTGDPFVERTGTVTFDHWNADMSITTSQAGGETFYNLVQSSGTQDLSLNDDITIATGGTLTMTSGNIELGNFDLFLDGTAGISGGSSGSMILTEGTGMIQDDFPSTGLSETYPLGSNAARYNPLTFDLDAGTLASAYIRVSVTNGAHPHIGSPDDYINHYWTINPSGITGSINYDITATYIDFGAGGGTGSESNLIPWKFSNGAWTSGGSVNDVANTWNWDDMTSFSDYTLLSTTATPLPVNLTHFEAINQMNAVELKWETKSEINNDYFTIARSADGNIFDVIGEVDGNGNSNVTLEYSFFDEQPLAGTSYYQLSQTDFDGTTEFFDIVAVERGASLTFDISPNPVPQGQLAKLKYNFDAKPEEEEVLVVLYDLTGKIVYSKVEIIEQLKDGVIALDSQNKLKPGIYSVQASSNNKLYQQKLVIH